MQNQSTMLVGFIRTVFFVILFYYLFKIIGRFVLPLLLKKGVENMQKKQQEQFRRYQEQARQKEGEVTIKQNQKHKSSGNNIKEEGEYVDFEEIN